MNIEPEIVNIQGTSADFEFAVLQEAKNYRRSLISEFYPYLHGDIIEVGAGIGQMTRELASVPNINSIVALEPDNRFYGRLKEQGLRANCFCGTMAQMDPASRYDGIVSVNVLEHIADDFGELKRFNKHLKAGSHLCLFVPASPFIYAPIDATFGHYRRYAKTGLRMLLEEAGFQVIRLDYYNSLGFFAWWLNFCVLKKQSFEIEKVRFYDRFLFPAVHSLETRLMRPPFGQSLLAIAKV